MLDYVCNPVGCLLLCGLIFFLIYVKVAGPSTWLRGQEGPILLGLVKYVRVDFFVRGPIVFFGKSCTPKHDSSGAGS